MQRHRSEWGCHKPRKTGATRSSKRQDRIPPRVFGGNVYLIKHLDFSVVLYIKRWQVLFLVRAHAQKCDVLFPVSLCYGDVTCFSPQKKACHTACALRGLYISAAPLPVVTAPCGQTSQDAVSWAFRPVPLQLQTQLRSHHSQCFRTGENDPSLYRDHTSSRAG